MKKNRTEYFRKYREANREMVRDINRRAMRKRRLKAKQEQWAEERKDIEKNKKKE